MTNDIKPTFRDYDIIRYPLMTEKSTMILEKANAYVFVVDKTSNKTEIKEAVERVFEVKVVSVNTIVSKGKNKIFKGRRGKRGDFKKAIVRLKFGDKIELGVGA
ncbi:MAG: 50S ribosomal protein L23 [Holosporales bacterium]|jgi:large subunit ribosomal protein L23|nr:50S ribosomal protein L23 [Holosporales bacterium]